MLWGYRVNSIFQNLLGESLLSEIGLFNVLWGYGVIEIKLLPRFKIQTLKLFRTRIESLLSELTLFIMLWGYGVNSIFQKSLGGSLLSEFELLSVQRGYGVIKIPFLAWNYQFSFDFSKFPRWVATQQIDLVHHGMKIRSHIKVS